MGEAPVEEQALALVQEQARVEPQARVEAPGPAVEAAVEVVAVEVVELF